MLKSGGIIANKSENVFGVDQGRRAETHKNKKESVRLQVRFCSADV